MRAALLAVGVMIVSACGGNNVTSPTLPPGAAADAWAGRGTVHDAIGRAIAGARVTVLDGPQRGVTVFTDGQGSFQFEPVFRSGFNVRASKAGYRDHAIWIPGPETPARFRLDSINAALNISGNYTLTFTADTACTSIPGYARRRSYEAAVSYTGGTILVSLGGGGYGGAAGGGYFNNVLYARVFEDTLQLYLTDPPVLEHFQQGSYLMISGQADGSVGDLPTTIPVRASFVYCAESASTAEPRCAVTPVRCESSNHRLSIARR